MAVKKPLLIATAALTVPIIVAAGITTVPTESVVAASQQNNLTITDDNKISARAAKRNGKIKVVKTRKNRKTVVTISGVAGKTSYQALARKGKVKFSSLTRKVSLNKNVVKVRFEKAGYKPRMISLPNKRIKRTYSFAVETNGASPTSTALWDPKLGSKTDFKYMDRKNRKLSFDPCTYEVVPAESGDLVVETSANTRGNTIYYGGKFTSDSRVLADVKFAFERIAKVTGHRFVHANSRVGDPNSIEFTAKVLTNNQLPSGFAGPLFTSWGSIESGNVNLSLNYKYAPRHTNRLVVLHEIMHVMGLDHAKSTKQVMAPGHGFDRGVTLGAGDYAGLRALRYQAKCHLAKGDIAFEGF